MIFFKTRIKRHKEGSVEARVKHMQRPSQRSPYFRSPLFHQSHLPAFLGQVSQYCNLALWLLRVPWTLPWNTNVGSSHISLPQVLFHLLHPLSHIYTQLLKMQTQSHQTFSITTAILRKAQCFQQASRALPNLIPIHYILIIVSATPYFSLWSSLIPACFLSFLCCKKCYSKISVFLGGEKGFPRCLNYDTFSYATCAVKTIVPFNTFIITTLFRRPYSLIYSEISGGRRSITALFSAQLLALSTMPVTQQGLTEFRWLNAGGSFFII